MGVTFLLCVTVQSVIINKGDFSGVNTWLLKPVMRLMLSGCCSDLMTSQRVFNKTFGYDKANNEERNVG